MVPMETIMGRVTPISPADDRNLSGLQKTVKQLQAAINRVAESVTRMVDKLTGYDKRLELLERPTASMPDISKPIDALTKAITAASTEFRAEITKTAERIEAAINSQNKATAALFHTLTEQINATHAVIRQGDTANSQLIGIVREDLAAHVELSGQATKTLQLQTEAFRTRLESFVTAQEKLTERDGKRELSIRQAEDRIQRLEARPIVTLDPAMEAASQLKQQLQLHWDDMEGLRRELNFARVRIGELERRTWWTLFKQMWRRK